MVIRSQQYFAHITTAKLSFHARNVVAITQLQLQCELSEICIKFHFGLNKPLVTWIPSLNLLTWIYHDDVIKWKHFPRNWLFCAGNTQVTGGFPAQRPVTRSFGVFYDLHLNKRLSKQSWGRWFETPSRPLWRHCNAIFPSWSFQNMLYHSMVMENMRHQFDTQRRCTYRGRVTSCNSNLSCKITKLSQKL